jgi:hypothetical protein
VSAHDKQIGGDHYRTLAIQPSEFIHKNGLDWYSGNAIKYIVRHRLKGGRQDIEKAIHYLELLMSVEYPSTPLKASHAVPEVTDYP